MAKSSEPTYEGLKLPHRIGLYRRMLSFRAYL